MRNLKNFGGWFIKDVNGEPGWKSAGNPAGKNGLTVKLASLGKIAILGALFALSATPNIGAARADIQERDTIKRVSIVEESELYLSDLFTGIRPERDRLVGRAPAPGEEIEISARVLSRLARIYDISWRPSSTADVVRIRRDASIIDSSAISRTLKEKLGTNGLGDDESFNIHYTGGAPELTLPRGVPARFDIDKIVFNPHTDRFQATIAAPSAQSPRATLDISGYVERMIEVPTLRTSLRNGTVISRADILPQRVRVRTLGADVVTDAEALIGLTPERFIPARKPVRREELTAPLIVNRGERITLLHQQGSLRLTASGRSLENGALGDIISVINIDSNKKLYAEVSGSGSAIIR